MTVPAPATRLTLLAWLSPAFPVGSFAYSQGLESVHAAGELGGVACLRDWLETLLEAGSTRNDAILLSLAWQAAHNGAASELFDLNELAVALAGGRERRLEITAQGTAFARTVRASWPAAKLEAVIAPIARGPLAYPVAVGACAAAHDLPLLPTVEAFLFAAIGNSVSAATRLGAIGQTDAQRVLAHFAERIPASAAEAIVAGRDGLGSATLRADIFGFHHEALYSRVFRT